MKTIGKGVMGWGVLSLLVLAAAALMFLVTRGVLSVTATVAVAVLGVAAAVGHAMWSARRAPSPSVVDRIGWVGVAMVLGTMVTFSAISTKAERPASVRISTVDGRPVVSITGSMTRSTLGEVVRKLRAVDGDGLRVCLDTDGGDVPGGIAIAQLLAWKGPYEVYARRCESACAHLWAAATQRHMVHKTAAGGTSIGLHRVHGGRHALWLWQWASDEQMVRRGVNAATLERAREVSADEMWWLTAEELEAAGLRGVLVDPETYRSACVAGNTLDAGSSGLLVHAMSDSVAMPTARDAGV
jgi:hypothetical protein